MYSHGWFHCGCYWSSVSSRGSAADARWAFLWSIRMNYMLFYWAFECSTVGDEVYPLRWFLGKLLSFLPLNVFVLLALLQAGAFAVCAAFACQYRDLGISFSAISLVSFSVILFVATSGEHAICVWLLPNSSCFYDRVSGNDLSCSGQYRCLCLGLSVCNSVCLFMACCRVSFLWWPISGVCRRPVSFRLPRFPVWPIFFILSLDLIRSRGWTSWLNSSQPPAFVTLCRCECVCGIV